MNKINEPDQIDRENAVFARNMLLHYTISGTEPQSFIYEDVNIYIRYVRTTGSATTRWRVVVEHPGQGWSFALCCVWRNGQLVQSVSGDEITEYYADDEVLVKDSHHARIAANDWLRSI